MARPTRLTLLIHLSNRSVALRADAAYFVDWIDRLIQVCASAGRYPSDRERNDVAAIFRKGQAYYARIVADAGAS